MQAPSTAWALLTAWALKVSRNQLLPVKRRRNARLGSWKVACKEGWQGVDRQPIEKHSPDLTPTRGSNARALHSPAPAACGSAMPGGAKAHPCIGVPFARALGRVPHLASK